MGRRDACRRLGAGCLRRFRDRARGFGGRWLAAVAGIALLFVGGISWLTIFTGSFSQAVHVGITPFAVFDLVKGWIAAAVTGKRTTHRTS